MDGPPSWRGADRYRQAPLYSVPPPIAQELEAALIDLEKNADVLTEALVDVLSGLDTARAEDAVLRFFSEHALVDEVFADEAEIRDALRSERSWSRGERRSEGLRGVWCCFLPPHAQGVGRPSSS
jgi:hypothetical protein